MEHGLVIVAGFGFRARASEASLADALARTGKRPAALATAADKAAALAGLGARLGLPVIPVPEAALAAQQTATRSAAAEAARGTGSVAEAAALAAAGPGARLLAARVISTDRLATCALAEGDAPAPDRAADNGNQTAPQTGEGDDA